MAIVNGLKTQRYYTGNGVQTVFNFAMDYLRPNFMYLRVDGVQKTYGVDYLVTGQEMQIFVPPPNLATVFIYRSTSTDPLVSWADASVLRASDMTLQEMQLLQGQEEISDIVSNDIADLTLRAESARDRAVIAETNSGLSEDNAKVSEDNAKASEISATASAGSALVSKDASKVSEDNAKISEDNAKTFEDNAKISELNAKTSETASGISEVNAKMAETNAKSSEVLSTSNKDIVVTEVAKVSATVTDVATLKEDVAIFKASGGGVPIGTYIESASPTAPTGYLECIGGVASRITYANLFSLIGTTYGVGDGSTTFKLPDRRDRFALAKGTAYATIGATGGETTHVLTIAEMPNHSHTVPSVVVEPGSGISVGKTLGATASQTTSAIGGGTAHNNMPPYFVVNYYIKY